jgi:hypothetical protein
MEKFTKVKAKKYLDAIKKGNKKYVTSQYLSSTLGIHEDVVREELSRFDDFIRLLDDYNLVDIIPQLQSYINTRVKREMPTQKYTSIVDFMYKNMTTHGGLIDKSVKLNKTQLNDLHLLIKKEMKKVKK